MAMRYGKSLFQNNETYSVHRYKNRAEWLRGRSDLRGIGGSDASSCLGLNPWRTNLELWEIKTGRKVPQDISENERVWYGSNAEEYIRRLFQLKHALEYEIQYLPNVILQNEEHHELLYSPDGLIRTIDGRNGILEIKTTTIVRSYEKEKWYDRQKKEPVLPDNYYIQVLHGLNVTGFEFVDLFAELTYPSGRSELIPYHIEREEVADDLQTVQDEVIHFWRDYVLPDKEPGLILPAI